MSAPNDFATQIFPAGPFVGRPALARPACRSGSLPTWILFVLACCAALFWTSIAWSQQQIGTAYRIRPDVRATREIEPEPVTLYQARPIFQKDLIDTQADSAALLRFWDNTGIAIGPETSITLDQVVYNPDLPAESKFDMRISRGAVRVATGNLRNFLYLFEAAEAKVRPSGTVMTITVSARGATVSVVEGSATVNTAGRTVTVAAGQSTLVLRGAPPTPPVPTPPPPPIIVEMDRLLQTASLQEFGTRAAARSPAVEAPSDAGTHTFSPNIDGKIQSEIAGGVSRGTHAASRGTH
jgi:hypothetical protein